MINPKESTKDFTLTFTDMPPAIDKECEEIRECAKDCEDMRLATEWGSALFYPGFFHATTPNPNSV